jgi:hypothetical protein
MDNKDPQSAIRNPQFFITAVLLLSICCAPQTVFDRIEDGDFTMVNKGRYDRPAVFLDEGREYRASVLEIRRVIEKHFDLMPLITKQYYPVDRDLAFTFKYVLLDTIDRCFVLRYFARTHNDPLLAGYEIFFASDTATKQVTGIFTGEVPLE